MSEVGKGRFESDIVKCDHLDKNSNRLNSWRSYLKSLR